MKIFILFLSSLAIINITCKSQTEREKIIQTANNVLSFIKSKDSIGFEKLNQHEVQQNLKTTQMVKWDFKKCTFFFDSVYNKQLGSFKISDSLDVLSRLKVIIPIKEYKDSLKITLNLFFGPPQVVPLNSLSGYELLFEYKKTPTIHSL